MRFATDRTALKRVCPEMTLTFTQRGAMDECIQLTKCSLMWTQCAVRPGRRGTPRPAVPPRGP